MSTTNKALISKDTANKRMTIIREFAAPVDRVWAAWTQSELLDQWWAPRPYKVETKSMDFRVGGFWLYAMVGPDGSRQYCRFDYQAIDEEKSYSGVDAFCDEYGIASGPFPNMTWNNVFTASEAGTTVTAKIQFASEEDMNKIIGMGFEQGFTAAHGNLDELLEG